jgi:monoamine oxidase
VQLIVVGAGVAGLTTADAARCAGADVVVLEARDRLGGRTCTVPLGAGWVDVGAAWVHHPFGNPLAEALEAARIRTRNDGAFHSRMAVWSDGWVDAPLATALGAAAEADWDPAQALAALPDSDRYVDGVEWFLADRDLDDPVRDLARFGLLWIVGAMVIGGPPDRISLAGAAEYAEGGGGNLVPQGGYRKLVERLSAGLDVRLATPVATIEHGGSGVLVHSEQETFEGDRVVVTVPLGVLQAGALSFDPPLGDDHDSAVNRLAMATIEKVVLRFSERFWPEPVWQIAHVDKDRAFPVWLDFTRHTGSPTLVAFHNPAISRPLARLKPDQRVGAALDVLAQMFGPVSEPEEAIVTDWREDPWARGSYSYIPVGADADDMRSIAEPVSDRLLFAGEATVPECYGTVQAAFTSGLRAAQRTLGEPPRALSLGAVPQRWLD